MFDQYENYWLNAPEKFQCKNCEGKTGCKFNFLTTDDKILKQIGAIDPEILELFPCYVTQRNVIDKKITNMIIHCTVKGIGPEAMAKSIVSWHELEWQKKENLWARYCLKRLNQPIFGQDMCKREEIEQCPEYFSLRMGGCVPSGQWLVTMFCSTVETLCDY